eukprot:TRINITY_DN10373_c0_g1_i1.p1 TRINITY_DN10373_c0_g1~~TRINITY_DN10373_c0_g1_i1.p1  ORF type:complete len:100 (+),score=4.05 TRINITY_DN10373_c0_g1_i1:100-399(+)
MSPKFPPPATTLYITFVIPGSIYLGKSVKHLSTHSSHLVWTTATASSTAFLLDFLLVFNASRIVREDLFIFLLDSLHHYLSYTTSTGYLLNIGRSSKSS